MSSSIERAEQIERTNSIEQQIESSSSSSTSSSSSSSTIIEPVDETPSALVISDQVNNENEKLAAAETTAQQQQEKKNINTNKCSSSESKLDELVAVEGVDSCRRRVRLTKTNSKQKKKKS
jgi:hypothetical protein